MSGRCLNCHHLQDDGPLFGRIICTDWYDGVLSGFAECRQCGAAYWFSVVGWDTSSSVRVYAFMPLGDGEFEHVLDSLSALGSPRWPIWIPIWRFLDEAERLGAESQIAASIAGAGPPQYLAGSDDLAARVIDVRVLLEATEIDECMVAVSEADSLPDPGRLEKWLEVLRRPQSA